MWAGLAELFKVLSPLLLQIIQDYREGKLDRLKAELKDAKSKEDKLRLIRDSASRLHAAE